MQKTEKKKPKPKKIYRRPGAQAGNVNALKHGFYSARFRRGEIEDLASLAINDLSSEISANRVWIRRVLNKADDADEDQSLIESINVLYALGMASARVASLVRTQSLLHGSASDDFAHAASLALAAFMEDNNIM